MTNPVHILAVAALLLVAFLVGAVIGSLGRAIALRRQQKSSVAPAAQAEAVMTAAPLVAAPIIAQLPVAPAPLVPEPSQIPVPDFAATMIALADEKPSAGVLEPAQPAAPPAPAVAESQPMQPAHVAGETTSGIHIAAPRHDAPTVSGETVPTPGHRTAEVIPFPSNVTEPIQPNRSGDIVVGGETVVVVDASDLAPAEPAVATPVAGGTDQPPHNANEDRFLFVPADQPRELAPAAVAEPTSDTIPIPAFAANAPVGAVLAAALPAPEVVASAPVAEDRSVSVDTPTPEPEPIVVAEAVEPAAAAESAEPAAVEPVSAPEPQAEPIAEAAPEPMDEDAAMRAIEGNWSPRPPPKRVVRAVEAPEGANQAVAASARAVTAARRTAEAVVAESKVVVAEAKAEAGRPVGLDAPRDGRKDELTHIIGVLPVIETAFNKLGIYHFDQVGALTDENIGWIEGHLGLPGRIARELWREQARELSAVLKPRRAAEK